MRLSWRCTSILCCLLYTCMLYGYVISFRRQYCQVKKLPISENPIISHVQHHTFNTIRPNSIPNKKSKFSICFATPPIQAHISLPLLYTFWAISSNLMPAKFSCYTVRSSVFFRPEEVRQHHMILEQPSPFNTNCNSKIINLFEHC